MTIVQTGIWQVKASNGNLDKVYLNEDRPNLRLLNSSARKEGHFLESTKMFVEFVHPNQFRSIDGELYTIIE